MLHVPLSERSVDGSVTVSACQSTESDVSGGDGQCWIHIVHNVQLATLGPSIRLLPRRRYFQISWRHSTCCGPTWSSRVTPNSRIAMTISLSKTRKPVSFPSTYTRSALTSYRSNHSFLAVRALRPQERPPESHATCTKRLGHQDLAAPPDPAIDVDLNLLGQIGILCVNLPQCVESCPCALWMLA